MRNPCDRTISFICVGEFHIVNKHAEFPNEWEAECELCARPVTLTAAAAITIENLKGVIRFLCSFLTDPILLPPHNIKVLSAEQNSV